jgi:hypothetical protein
MDINEQIAQRHQAKCPDCAGLSAQISGGTGTCVRCRGTGHVGNCHDCGGTGLIDVSGPTPRPAGVDWSVKDTTSLRSCYTCRTKGWIGNCSLCRGQAVLNRDDGYALCPHCEGHGHVCHEFYSPGKAAFCAVVRVGAAGRFFVVLGSAPTRFGRFPHPYTHFRLFGRILTKIHFEIDWNAAASTHEVCDFGAFSLRLNGNFLAGEESRVRLHHGEPWEPQRHLLSPGDLLQIGDYTLEYFALHDDDRYESA